MVLLGIHRQVFKRFAHSHSLSSSHCSSIGLHSWVVVETRKDGGRDVFYLAFGKRSVVKHHLCGHLYGQRRLRMLLHPRQRVVLTLVKVVEVFLCSSTRNAQMLAYGQVREKVFVLVGFDNHLGIGPRRFFFRFHGVEQLVVVGRQCTQCGVCNSSHYLELSILNDGSSHFVVVRSLRCFQYNFNAFGQVGYIACNDKALL